MEQNGGAATAENEVKDSGAGNNKIKVSYRSNNFDVLISPQSTFADLKRVIAKEAGLEPEVQNLLLKEKEKDDQETLHMAGVKDNAKVILMENAPIKEEDIEKVEEIKESIKPIEEISRGVEAVSHIREENNEFVEQVVSY